MPKRRHAQRQHFIASLDALLYQLHTLSFILSPSMWSFICRLVSQFQCSKPRDFESSAFRSLRFLFSNILFFNAPSIWYHATQGAAQGRAIVLDFVGLAYVPSKTQLLGLDVLIIFLQLVLATVAYETAVQQTNVGNDTQDVLLPIPNSPVSPSTTPLPTSHTSAFASPSPGEAKNSSRTPSYILDLRIAPILARLRNPPPPTNANSNSPLPFPNTTPWQLPAGMRILIRTRGQARRNDDNNNNATAVASGPEPTIPGALVPRET